MLISKLPFLSIVLAHEVRITPAIAGATELSNAIAHAGFDPVLRNCGDAVRRFGQAPPKISFEGVDHDFTAASEGVDEKAHVEIAGASKSNSLLPADALGPLSH